MSSLDDKTAGQFIKALAAYAIEGETPKTSGVVATMLALVKPQIDANNRKYENGCKGGEYGHLGGRPAKNPTKTPRKPQENPTKTPNDNDNVNENASAYAGVYASLEVCAERAKANSSLRDRAAAAGVDDYEASVDDFADYLRATDSVVANVQEFSARYLANIKKRYKQKQKSQPLTDTDIEEAKALFPKANAQALALLTDSVLPAMQETYGGEALQELKRLAAKYKTVSEIWLTVKDNAKR